jgi:hypothetical protein
MYDVLLHMDVISHALHGKRCQQGDAKRQSVKVYRDGTYGSLKTPEPKDLQIGPSAISMLEETGDLL